MIVMLYLISANVYNAVGAPLTRGFSYIEVWILGTQAPILLALFEYGFILHLKKVEKKKTTDEIQDINHNDSDLDDKIKKLDYATMIFSLVSTIQCICIHLLDFSLYVKKDWHKETFFSHHQYIFLQHKIALYSK